MIPRTRIHPRREIASIRPITREDLPRLLGPRDKTAAHPKRLMESHHDVARFLAAGFDNARIAALTGYSANRISVLASAPAMQELVAHYRSKIDEAFIASQDAYFDLATRNMLAAERHIADRIAELDADGEVLPIRDAIAISRDAADRFGYGKKQTNLNVNADFAALLEKAIAKSGKVIDGAAQALPDRRQPRQGERGSSLDAPAPSPIRRLA